jgi:hypothetical protein
VPFVLHLAEGTDDEARGELPRLEALGCLKPNTVIVHGVAIDGDGWRRVARAGAGLVWCPASNDFLFGRSVPIRSLLDEDERSGSNGDCGHVNVALGTDSRVTGSRDSARRAARGTRRGAGVGGRAPPDGDDQRGGASPPTQGRDGSPSAGRPISWSSRRSTTSRRPRC